MKSSSLRGALALLVLLVSIGSIACGGAKPSANAPAAAPAAETATETSKEIVEATVTAVEGTVEVSDVDAKAWKPLEAGNGIEVGARVRAGAKSFADILLASKCAIRVKEGSEVVIEENHVIDGNQEIGVKLERGRVLHNFSGMASGSKYRLKTAVAAAAIRGTQFDASAQEGAATFRVLEGKVAVENAAGSTEIAEKQGTRVAAGTAPDTAQSLSENDVQELQECSRVNFALMLKKAHKIATGAEMRNIGNACDIFFATNERYPNSLAEAGINEPDDWGNAYHYELTGGGSGFIIRSNGPDKQPGTADDIVLKR